MTMVNSSALAIIVNSSVSVRFSNKLRVFLGAGGKRVATEALQRRAGCSKGRERWVETWPVRGGESQSKGGCGAARLGRCCAASARDLFGLRVDLDSHLNAWSSRK